VVNRKVLNLEMRLAAVANASLLAIKQPFVANIVEADELAYVGSLGNVGAVYNGSCQIVYTVLDQFGRLWRYVNANPLATKRVCCHTGGGTTAERV